MTESERLAKEAYDRMNPWRAMDQAKPDGTVCELLLNDMVGHFQSSTDRYFLDGGGRWYRIDPPGVCFLTPINWRPAFARLTPERRNFIKQQSSRRIAS
ncbi:MAG: hypothetical protein KDK08_18300 [Rhizobiaceae bacterium]|nr:hypothetical protein [Rhizobiaceae bacterium]